MSPTNRNARRQDLQSLSPEQLEALRARAYMRNVPRNSALSQLREGQSWYDPSRPTPEPVSSSPSLSGALAMMNRFSPGVGAGEAVVDAAKAGAFDRPFSGEGMFGDAIRYGNQVTMKDALDMLYSVVEPPSMSMLREGREAYQRGDTGQGVTNSLLAGVAAPIDVATYLAGAPIKGAAKVAEHLLPSIMDAGSLASSLFAKKLAAPAVVGGVIAESPTDEELAAAPKGATAYAKQLWRNMQASEASLQKAYDYLRRRQGDQ